MAISHGIVSDDQARYEVLPFTRIYDQAAALPHPARLTVTCSPMHGTDRTVQVASRLRDLGHDVTVHVAARMVRDRPHLDQLLAAIAAGGIDDLFLIGGDIEHPMGAYSSGGDVLPLIAEHPQRPRAIGIAGYPEAHPFISEERLEAALREKARCADYVITQMCFDAGTLRSWIERHREQGLTLPVVIGMPGKATRRKLLEMSARIGVGPSLRFLRKQRGLRSLLSRRSTADRLYDGLAPLLDGPGMNVAGFQYFTFNQLTETWEWQQTKLRARRDGAGQTARERRTTAVRADSGTSIGKESRHDPHQPSGVPGRVG